MNNKTLSATLCAICAMMSVCCTQPPKHSGAWGPSVSAPIMQFQKSNGTIVRWISSGFTEEWRVTKDRLIRSAKFEGWEGKDGLVAQIPDAVGKEFTIHQASYSNHSPTVLETQVHNEESSSENHSFYGLYGHDWKKLNISRKARVNFVFEIVGLTSTRYVTSNEVIDNIGGKLSTKRHKLLISGIQSATMSERQNLVLTQPGFNLLDVNGQAIVNGLHETDLETLFADYSIENGKFFRISNGALTLYSIGNGKLSRKRFSLPRIEGTTDVPRSAYLFANCAQVAIWFSDGSARIVSLSS